MKKKWINSLLNRVLGCITAVSLVAVSLVVPACEAADDTTDISDDELRYSGEDLFAGFFLNTGPVTGSVPSLQSERGKAMIEGMSDAEWTEVVTVGAEALRARGLEGLAEGIETTPREQLLAESDGDKIDGLSEVVIALIAAEEPEFFGRFATDIHSGDHYRVAAAMGEGSELLLNTLAGLDLGESTAASDSGFCIAFFIAYVAFISVAVNVAVAVNAVAAVNVAVTLDPYGETQKGLEGEVMIDEIARTFAR